ncbi:MAG: hypothetical protein IPJ81_00275 [Chitinophagaceae bacterium]|nr:hypothetical protein [Chitinophagaceae bacterium]
MKHSFSLFLILCIYSCQLPGNKKVTSQSNPAQEELPGKSYKEIKDSIAHKRKIFFNENSSLQTFSRKSINEITDFWINCISKDLYSKWQNTPWDFNGTTTRPQYGTIACGYFVTTILQDMDLKINRVKLSICASSIMMRALTPHQKIKNLSYLSYGGFNDTLKYYGKGVYIIGLDFHTGFIINDGTENWFIHSNYIQRKGVTKERVLLSVALKSSKTRWLISLTNDKNFLFNWLKGQHF